MKNNSLLLKSSLALFAMCLAAPLAHAQFAASTGFDYTSGKYGYDTETKVSSWNVTGEYAYEGLTTRIVIPQLRVTSPVGTVVIAGRPRLQNRINALNQGKTETESGRGDVELSASYNFLHNRETDWSLSLAGSVKLPTADDDKGLGTGKTDYGIALDLSRSFGHFTPTIGFGYRIIGNPTGANLKDYAYASIGAGFWITDTTNLSLTLESDQPDSASSGVDNELSLGLNQHLGKHWDIEAHVLVGLSKSAPDKGLGASVRFTF